jgi:hypothetical protein
MISAGGSLTLAGTGITNLSAVTQTISNAATLSLTNSGTVAGSIAS